MARGLDIEVNETWRDLEGRCIMCVINHQGHKIALCNIYAPNEDKPEFFE